MFCVVVVLEDDEVWDFVCECEEEVVWMVKSVVFKLYDVVWDVFGFDNFLVLEDIIGLDVFVYIVIWEYEVMVYIDFWIYNLM